MRLYLAGRMRGVPECNYPAFEEARNRLRALGHTVFCPAALSMASDMSPEDDFEPWKLTFAAQMDITCILNAEAIALLPGWEDSVGVSMELAVAQFLRLKVLCAVRMKELRIPEKPWSLYYDVYPPKLKEE